MIFSLIWLNQVENIIHIPVEKVKYEEVKVPVDKVMSICKLDRTFQQNNLWWLAQIKTVVNEVRVDIPVEKIVRKERIVENPVELERIVEQEKIIYKVPPPASFSRMTLF